jgi:Na+/H+ antiporter NhaD/arsenite permease-like protein
MTGNASTWSFYLPLAIFVVTYVGIFLQRLHTTVVAMAGAVTMICVGAWLSFYDIGQVVASVDVDTLCLLFGMMIVVALFGETGFFQYIAIRAAKLARGRPWLLLVYLGSVTCVVSMFLDNVTTILILAPVTISLADILGIAPLPFLVGEAVLSNVGGVATLIGDPPNILIGSAAGFSFMDFITHLLPIVLIVWACTVAILLLLFRRDLARPTTQIENLLRMDAKRAIVKPKVMRRMLIVLVATILLFFVHQVLHLGPGVVALIGASAGLLWVRPDFDTIIREVHWDVLLFFLALFVIVGGIEAAGVTNVLGSGIAGLAGRGMSLAIIVILWVSALSSGVLSNVPLTIAMIPILKGVALQGIPIAPLWWALAVGVGFGANLTPVASAASMVVISLSKSSEDPITFRRWLRFGTPIALASCVLGTGALLLAYRFGLL